MHTRDLKALVDFSTQDAYRQTVFETARVWTQIVCFDRNQRMGPVMDDASDAVITVIAGEAVVQVDNSRKRLGQWEAVLVPGGSELTLTNASPDPLVIMLTAAPPPAPRQGDR